MFKFILFRKDNSNIILAAKQYTNIGFLDLFSLSEKFNTFNIFHTPNNVNYLGAGYMTVSEDGYWMTNGDGMVLNLNSDFCRTQEGFKIMTEIRMDGMNRAFYPFGVNEEPIFALFKDKSMMKYLVSVKSTIYDGSEIFLKEEFM